MSATHKTIKSPDPSRRSLSVAIGESNFETSGGIIPPAGTRYDDEVFKSYFGKDYKNRFKNYIYTDQGEDTRDGGTLLFGPPPILGPDGNVLPFRSVPWFGNHYWHTILLELKPLKVAGFPLATQVGVSTVNADRYVMREVYIPAATEGSRFVKEEYISPFVPKIAKTPVPIASAVTYDLINRRGGFPECIHDRLIIPAVTTVAGQQLPQQIFPETNFTTWSPYVISTSEPRLVGGVWYWFKIRVYPPAIPEEVVRTV